METLKSTSKTWCKHIKWDNYLTEARDLSGWEFTTGCHVIVVGRSWKVCPICRAERPVRANKKAAALRFSMGIAH